MTLREHFGCWANERWRTEFAMLSANSRRWVKLCNRHEVLAHDPVSDGWRCEWKDSSPLTVARVFPKVASRLFNFCFRQWPVSLNFEPKRNRSALPNATAVIAIGGTDRLQQFHTVLASLRGQSYDALEILVVEQSPRAEIESQLPDDVRYVHSKTDNSTGFNKSQALNIGASLASGHHLLIHDADYLVPRDYVKEIVAVLTHVNAVRPSRLAFHLNEGATKQLLRSRTFPSSVGLEQILQNNPTPMALTRQTYWDIGGHDESFVGWGGEDTEFLSRLRTHKISEGGWIPTMHLWHPLAPKKASGHRNQTLQDEKLSLPVSTRIEALITEANAKGYLSKRNGKSR